MIKAAFFDTHPYDKEAFSAALSSHAGIEIHYFETKLGADTVSLARGYDCVVVFVNDTVDGTVLNALHEMGISLVALRCAGYNNVDIQSAYGKVHIVRVPAYSPHAVAEHAMAMLLTSVRRIHKAYNRTRDFNFTLNGFVGFDLYGKTVGIIGTGKIGRTFAEICRGFGMHVLAYDPYPAADAGLCYVDLATLFEKSDILSLHCPLTKDTYHLVNAKSIAQMKKGVVLINTSRGALIDAEALIDGIKQKIISAACLDVYEEESDLFFEDFSGHIVQDDTIARLLSLPNVILTAHQAFLTKDALGAIAETTLANIEEYFAGKPLQNEICYRCEKKESCKKERPSRCF